MKTARKTTAKVWAALILCAVAAACTTRPGDNDSAPAPRPVAARSEGIGTPLDLASVMRRAHFRFRAEGDGFVAQQTSYEARVSAAGALSVAAPSGRPLVLETLASGGARPVIAADGGIAIARDRCVTEHAVGTDGGIEQSWVYDCAPPAGDLVVRVAASGLAPASSDDRGLVFGDAKSAIRYGAATWVDARGARTAVRPEWNGGTITLRVPDEVLRRSAYPATLDPLVEAEIKLDEPAIIAARSTQDHAAIAFNGTSYFVVWDDLRNGDWDIYGARIHPATGQVLAEDAKGVPVSTVAGNQQFPEITTNGTDFFVVWQDSRAASSKTFGARVAGGQVVAADVGGFALGGGGFTQRLPHAAWDGANYFVIWEDGRNTSTDVFGMRVAPDGKPFAADANGIAIDTAVSAQTRPRVACDGTRCLVVWTDNRAGGGPTPNLDVYGARVVSATGVVVDVEPAPLPIAVGASSQTTPAIAYDSVRADYLVTWDDFTSSGGAPDILGRRIDRATGASLDATPIAIATGAQAQRGSSVAFDGTRFLVTWTNAAPPATIFGALIAGDGTRTAAAALGAPSTAESGSTVAGGPLGFYAAWTEISTTAASDVYGTRVSATTAAPLEKPPTVITAQANAELSPAVATDGTGYFVVWEDWRSSAPGDVYGVRVSAAGVVDPQDQAGVLIAVAAPAGSASGLRRVQPAIAFGAGTYLVSWTDRRPPDSGDGLITAVYALRVNPSTGRPEPADTNGVRVSTDAGPGVQQTGPALAFTGGAFLAAWRDGRNGPDNVYARPIRVGASGLTLDPEVRVGRGPNASTAPSIAGDGAQTFLVAWQDFRDQTRFVAYAARLDTTGKVKAGDDGGFAVSQVTANQISASVAWSGTEFFVAWEDHRAHGADGEIFGRRIPLSGPPNGDDIPIAAGRGSHESPSVTDARDGAPGGNLEVVWRDDRHGQWDVYGSLVSRDGLVREPKGLAIALEAGDKGPPSIAAIGNGEMLVAYARLDSSVAFGVTRARARIVSTGQRAGTCTKDDDCATRFCTDGSCCDDRCDQPCRACGTGSCKLVTSGQDDRCDGISSCSATGMCQRANGQSCQASTECASGTCDRDDGVCCDRACDGECNTCKSKAAPGICTALVAGTAPVNCLPFACDGKSDSCPTRCEGDIMCARPNVCLPGGKCEALTASTCIDDHTIKSPSGLVTDCAPYACAGSTCANPCKSIADCVGGFVCDVDGTCVEPPRPAEVGGCSCRTTTSAPTHGHLAWLAAALFAVLRRTRRRTTS